MRSKKNETIKTATLTEKKKRMRNIQQKKKEIMFHLNEFAATSFLNFQRKKNDCSIQQNCYFINRPAFFIRI